MSLARGPLSLKFNYFIAHAMLAPLPSLKENTHGETVFERSLNKNVSFLISVPNFPTNFAG